MGEPAWLAAAGHALFTFCSYLLKLYHYLIFLFLSQSWPIRLFPFCLTTVSNPVSSWTFSILLRSLARRCRRSYRQKKPSIFAIRLWEGSWLVGHAPYLFSLVDLGGLLICVRCFASSEQQSEKEKK